MTSDTQTTALNFPLVIPTKSQVPTARLILRNDLGQVVQQWLIQQNKCTLGSSSGCTLRCQIPGIAPYHALLVVGARQSFVRGLAPKLTRDGMPINEFLLSQQNNYFEIAGHRFELSLSGEGSRAHSSSQSENKERLKFTLARPFELNKRKQATPTQSTASLGDREPEVHDSKWVAKLIQSAIEPLECQIQNVLDPIAEIQAESRKQRQILEEQRESESNPASPSREELVAARNAEHIDSQLQALAAKQSAAMDLIGERISAVNSQLSAIEQIIAHPQEANAPEEVRDDQTVNEQFHAIQQLQSGMVSVSNALQGLEARQQANREDDQAWRNQIQDQVTALRASIEDLAEKTEGNLNALVAKTEQSIEKNLLNRNLSEDDMAWESSIQDQFTQLREAVDRIATTPTPYSSISTVIDLASIDHASEFENLDTRASQPFNELNGPEFELFSLSQDYALDSSWESATAINSIALEFDQTASKAVENESTHSWRVRPDLDFLPAADLDVDTLVDLIPGLENFLNAGYEIHDELAAGTNTDAPTIEQPAGDSATLESSYSLEAAEDLPFPEPSNLGHEVSLPVIDTPHYLPKPDASGIDEEGFFAESACAEDTNASNEEWLHHPSAQPQTPHSDLEIDLHATQPYPWRAEFEDQDPDGNSLLEDFEHSLSQPEAGDWDLDEAEASELEASELEASELEASELEASELEASELEASELEDSELEDSELEASELEDSELEDSELEDSELEDSELEDSELEASELEASELEDSELEDSDTEVAECELADTDFDGSKAGSLETDEQEDEANWGIFDTERAQSSPIEQTHYDPQDRNAYEHAISDGDPSEQDSACIDLEVIENRTSNAWEWRSERTSGGVPEEVRDEAREGFVVSPDCGTSDTDEESACRSRPFDSEPAQTEETWGESAAVSRPGLPSWWTDSDDASNYELTTAAVDARSERDSGSSEWPDFGQSIVERHDLENAFEPSAEQVRISENDSEAQEFFGLESPKSWNESNDHPEDSIDGELSSPTSPGKGWISRSEIDVAAASHDDDDPAYSQGDPAGTCSDLQDNEIEPSEVPQDTGEEVVLGADFDQNRYSSSDGMTELSRRVLEEDDDEISTTFDESEAESPDPDFESRLTSEFSEEDSDSLEVEDSLETSDPALASHDFPADEPEQPTARESSEEHSEDASIEDYMRKLLARMRGVPEQELENCAPPRDALRSHNEHYLSNGQENSEDSYSSGPVVESGGAQTQWMASGPITERSQSGATTVTTSTLSLDQFTPRVAIPEKVQNLAAMRELANSTARIAIHRSACKRHLSGLVMKATISAIGLSVGLVLIAINGFNVNIGLIATVAAFLVATIWGYDAMVTLKPLLEAGLILKASPRQSNEQVASAQDQEEASSDENAS